MCKGSAFFQINQIFGLWITWIILFFTNNKKNLRNPCNPCLKIPTFAP